MRYSGSCKILGWYNVEAFALLLRKLENFTLVTQFIGLHKRFVVVSFPTPSILVYYSYIILQNRTDAFSLWYLTITGYSFLSVTRFLVLARDGAVSYQYSKSGLLHLSCGVPVPSPARLHTRVHEYDFRHIIDWSAFDYASARHIVSRLS